MMSIQILSLSEVRKNEGILRTQTEKVVRHVRDSQTEEETRDLHR